MSLQFGPKYNMEQKYIGYIYLWYDTKMKVFYVGGHKGRVEDSYVCSSAIMIRRYKRRPKTFRMRVLEYVYKDEDLRPREQYWLNLIKDEELYWTPNFHNRTVRYYNQKKTSAGGCGHANKGKRLGMDPWNKGKRGVQKSGNRFTWRVISPTGKEEIVDTIYIFCRENNVSRTTLYSAYKRNKPVKGWQVFLLDGTPARNRRFPN